MKKKLWIEHTQQNDTAELEEEFTLSARLVSSICILQFGTSVCLNEVHLSSSG